MFVWFSLDSYVEAFFASLLVSSIILAVFTGSYFLIYYVLMKDVYLSRKRELSVRIMFAVVALALSVYTWWQNYTYTGVAIEHGSSRYLSKTDIVVTNDELGSFLLINKVGNKPIRFYTVDKEGGTHNTVTYIDVAPGESENNRNIDKSVNVPVSKAGDFLSKNEGNGLLNDGFSGTKIIHVQSPWNPHTHVSDYDDWFVVNHSDQRVDIIDSYRPFYKMPLQPVSPHRMINQ